MRHFVPALLVSGLLALTLACFSPDPEPIVIPPLFIEPQGVVIPYPEEGNQYRMSEVCGSLQEQGYDVMGTLTHTFGEDDFDSVLENIPSLARKPVENYLRDGLSIEVELGSLCQALNN